MIALSGMNGFLGKHLSKALSQMGQQVQSIPRELLYQPTELIKFFNQHKPEIIYHLAAYGNMSNQTEESKIVYANIEATFNMLWASENIDYKKFVYISTSSVNLPVQTMYSATKKAGELIADIYRQRGKPILTVRPYSLFGEGEAKFRFIPTVCNALLTGKEFDLDPTPMHDWIYVKHFIRELLRSLGREDIIEIGSGHQTSNMVIVELLEEIAGKKANFRIVTKLRNYDTENWRAEKLKRFSLQEGLKNTWEYYKYQYNLPYA